MIAIIRRTVLDSLQGMQFWILIAMSLVLFITNGVLFCNRYAESRTQYEHAVTAVVPSTVEQSLYVPPSPLRFMHDGGAAGMPAGYTLKPKGTITPLPGNPANVKLPIVSPLDWSFIVTVVFSLFVILLAYDAVSGEREDGTLKLILSNSVSRAEFLFARYCAIMMIVSVTLIAGMLANFALIGILHPGLLSADTLASAGMVVLMALFLCSFFALTSILVSSRISSSPVILLILLVVWAGFTVIVPNTAPVVARVLTTVPSEMNMTRATQHIMYDDLDARMEDIRAKSREGAFASKRDIEQNAYTAYTETQLRILRQYEAYNHALYARDRTARMIARLSPIALFRYAAENITRTGERRDLLFRKAVEGYSAQYDRYILRKVGELTPQSPWSFVWSFDFKGEELRISSPLPPRYSGDTRDFPVFQPPRFPLSDGLASALRDICGILVWNLLAAVGVFASVRRMEVR